MIRLPGGEPITQQEWIELVERFPDLNGTSEWSGPELRRLMDRAIEYPSSYSPAQQKRYRAIVRDQVGERRLGRDPFFELEWLRVSHEVGRLNDDPEYARDLLWDAYYAPKDRVAGHRGELREEWRNLAHREDRRGEFVYGDT